MAVTENPKTAGRSRPSFAKTHDIDEFVSTLERYERGELTPDQWRAFRLVRGTYGQRQPGDVQMLRIKIPQGILTAAQLDVIADIGERYSRGFGHITTRQNIQFHFVKLHDAEPAMRLLADAGITMREACGNSVRNITCCQYAGVSADEVFDVTPYAEAMTRYFLRHKLSSSLPRKFKIAWEGCPEDHAQTAIHDLGFRAVIRGQGASAERGFLVRVGGGTSILCRSAQVLYEFLPAGDILNVAEAVLRVFHRLGDYKHKQANRMKFMMKALGWERWHAEYEQALAAFVADGGARLAFDPEHPPVEEPPSWDTLPAPSTLETTARVVASKVLGPGIIPEVRPMLPMMNGDYAQWLGTNVRAQKQRGYHTVTATIPLGDLTSQQMRVMGTLAQSYSDGSVRITADQNLVFRWVRESTVPELYRQLCAAGLGLHGANTIVDVTSCPGAESCRLAVTQSRGLGKYLSDFLRDRPDLAALAPDVQLKISGCPNGCGRHHIAGLGFQGSVRKVGKKPVPQYFVLVGGAADDDGATFGRVAAKVPARRLQDAVERLLRLYASDRRDGETATAFFKRVDLLRARQVLLDLERITPADARPDDFVDLAEVSEFNPEVMDGECSA